MKRIIDYFLIIYYYLLLFIGLIMTSWIIWSRFIRSRTIRELPDSLLTEYRFWILIYICCIYIYSIKNILKASGDNYLNLKDIIEILYAPLKTIDHAIKYNKYIKPYYYKFVSKFYNFTETKNINDDQIQVFVFFMQIFPRIILVSILMIDTFYFNKLEIFYKFVLLGLFPFIFRYFKYSLKDVYEHWIVELENKYSLVRIYEVGYKFDDSRKKNTKAIYHDEEKTIREYIEIKFNNIIDYLLDEVDYEYESTPYCKSEVYNEYCLNKYKNKKALYTSEDLDILRALYCELMPNIIHLKMFLSRIEVVSEVSLMKTSKIVIFGGYLVCWAYILIISYYNYPIDLIMSKYLLLNFMLYLVKEENPFMDFDSGSHNKNLLTIENIKKILCKIIKNIIQKWSKE
uniref:Uncharacterized protein n=1 Tax=Physarum polycephalum TaxID=5791 RepID=Q9MJ78_PHYPO|nr:hypothetical protein PhpooMp05 [Physarum polycephalum]BAB08084.1 unnamed protein product [Physarum polycephalum]